MSFVVSYCDVGGEFEEWVLGRVEFPEAMLVGGDCFGESRMLGEAVVEDFFEDFSHRVDE